MLETVRTNSHKRSALHDVIAKLTFNQKLVTIIQALLRLLLPFRGDPWQAGVQAEPLWRMRMEEGHPRLLPWEGPWQVGVPVEMQWLKWTKISHGNPSRPPKVVSFHHKLLCSRNSLSIARVYSGRNSPNRGYIEISGRESRAASRADMRQSWTTPNLNEHQFEPQQQQARKPSYSRHYEHNGYNQHRNTRYNEYDLNGRRIKHNEHEEYAAPPSNMRHSTSLSLLPLARDAHNLSFRDKYNRPGSDWNLTTTKRSFRYSEEGFKNARAEPFKPVPSLKIAVD